jgi:hypothetical protein
MIVNIAWHECHTMVKDPSVDQEILWHIAHKQHCGCSEIPARIQRLMAARGVHEEPVGFNVGLDEHFHPDTEHLVGHSRLP